ncbi:MAG: alpha-galactosidase [Bacteroidaceae bacterium]|nr:alpha-galactosidase [Bacteroidaceae bacterium]
MKHKLTVFALSALVAMPAFSVEPPTMGWSSWNTFALNINEDVIRGQADAMVSTGLSRVGYKYVNIDDGYWDGRGADGKLRLNTKLFPHGMRWLTNYIHAKGLKAGIYSDAGDNTCGSGNKRAWGLGVGFAGHDQEDCNLYFNDWNFDFIKVDYCGGRHLKQDERIRYTAISNAIKNTKRPDAQFNVCRWAYPGTWISDVATSWRTTGDIRSEWASVKKIIKENLYLSAFTGGGHYNDMDMLEIGRTLGQDEEITHMVMWCELSSPLLIGCDLTKVPEFSLNLMKNRELIAVNQDVLGLSAPVVQRQGEVYVFAKDLKRLHGPQRAVAVCNLTDEAQTIDVSLAAVGYDGSVKVRDAVHGKDLPDATGAIKVDIPAHGSRMLILNGTQRNEPTHYEAESAWLKEYNEIGIPGKAVFHTSNAASQGAYVGFLGNGVNNYMEWRDVYSKNGGRYKLTFKYMSAEPRDMRLAVNGAFVKEFTGLVSGHYTDKISECSVEVDLKKGYNTVRLSNPTAWAPNIDCVEVTKL